MSSVQAVRGRGVPAAADVAADHRQRLELFSTRSLITGFRLFGVCAPYVERFVVEVLLASAATS